MASGVGVDPQVKIVFELVSLDSAVEVSPLEKRIKHHERSQSRVLPIKGAIGEFHVLRGFDVGVGELKRHLIPCEVGVIVAWTVVTDPHFVWALFGDSLIEGVKVREVDADGDWMGAALPGLPPTFGRMLTLSRCRD